MDYYGETASSFAENISVQRSGISHILSGRNKPSLDFVLKVLSAYPEVELYWLLNGKGKFPLEIHSETQNNSDVKNFEQSPLSKSDSVHTSKIIQKKTSNANQNLLRNQNTDDKSIERIVIFYSDGTFKSFDQS